MRHSTRPRRNFRVRLACVKHAASVQSEPESNSPVQICCKDSRWTEIRISKFFPLALHLSKNRAPLSGARSTSTLPSAACQLLFFAFRNILSEPSFRRRSLSAAAKLPSREKSRYLSRTFFRNQRKISRPSSRGNLSRLPFPTGEGDFYAISHQTSSLLQKILPPPRRVEFAWPFVIVSVHLSAYTLCRISNS